MLLVFLGSTLVLLKVIVGYFAASNHSALAKCSSKAFTFVFRLETGIVTSTDELAGFALSTLIVP